MEDKVKEILSLMTQLRSVDNLDPRYDAISNQIKHMTDLIGGPNGLRGHNIPNDLHCKFLYAIRQFDYQWIDHFRILVTDALLKSNISKVNNIISYVNNEGYDIYFYRKELNKLIEDCKTNNLQDSLEWILLNKDDLIWD